MRFLTHDEVAALAAAIARGMGWSGSPRGFRDLAG
jgi:hypothetical protein